MCLYSLLFYAFVQQIQVIQFYSMSLKSSPGTLILQPSQEPVSSSKTRNMWHHHTPIETSEDQPHSSSAHAPWRPGMNWGCIYQHLRWDPVAKPRYPVAKWCPNCLLLEGTSIFRIIWVGRCWDMKSQKLRYLDITDMVSVSWMAVKTAASKDLCGHSGTQICVPSNRKLWVGRQLLPSRLIKS